MRPITPPSSIRSFPALRLPRLLAPLAAVLLAAVIAAGCGSSSHKSSSTTAPGSTTGRSAAAAVIVIKNFAYSPASLTVAPGATVTVKNEDTATHTVTATNPHNGAFDTGDIQPGGSTTFKAPTAAGSYPYICSIHQFMHGTLVVGG